MKKPSVGVCGTRLNKRLSPGNRLHRLELLSVLKLPAPKLLVLKVPAPQSCVGPKPCCI